MKKTQLALVTSCFGLAMVLSLLDVAKISTSIGGVNIHLYPSAGIALLGCVLLWRAFKQSTTSH
jgi:hypothetical protein